VTGNFCIRWCATGQDNAKTAPAELLMTARPVPSVSFEMDKPTHAGLRLTPPGSILSAPDAAAVRGSLNSTEGTPSN
jgi:hypothetical protein